MKVMHVLNHSLPHVDGYSMRSQNILLQQRIQGIDVVVVTSPKHERPRQPLEIIDGITFYRTFPTSSPAGLGALPFVRELLLMKRLRTRIREVAQKECVNVIHAHSPSLNGLPARAVARHLGLPVVYELRALWEDAATGLGTHSPSSLKYWASRWIETDLLKGVDAITTICLGLKNEIVARGIPAERINIFENGVDTERFSPRPVNLSLKQQLGLDRRFLLGFVGSFYHWEGLDVLLRAMQEIIPLKPEVHLLLVGSPQQEKRLKELAQSLGIMAHVTFTGKVEPSQVLDYYSIIDLCVYPRRKMRLTDLVTPLKPLEAMALGKLVLASDVGGHQELISDGMDGFLFKADDEADLKDKVLRIVDTASGLAYIRENARKRILLTRTWCDIVRPYANIYRLLTS